MNAGEEDALDIGGFGGAADEGEVGGRGIGVDFFKQVEHVGQDGGIFQDVDVGWRYQRERAALSRVGTDDEAAGFGQSGEDVGDAAIEVVGFVQGEGIPVLDFKVGGGQGAGDSQAIEEW